jgi:hypothetical protein
VALNTCHPEDRWIFLRCYRNPTAANGTPTGCPELDREDEHDAEMVFIEGLEPVSFESEAWDRDRGVLFDAELLSLEQHPWPVPASDDFHLEPSEADERWLRSLGHEAPMFGYE